MTRSYASAYLMPQYLGCTTEQFVIDDSPLLMVLSVGLRSRSGKLWATYV